MGRVDGTSEHAVQTEARPLLCDAEELLPFIRTSDAASLAVKSDTCNTKYTVKYLSEAPEPPSGGACGNPCPSGSDSECVWLGGANSCTKCDTTPGTRFTCVAP